MAVRNDVTSEDRVVREACGLLDRSERGKLALTGPEAKQFLNGQVTNDVLALTPGAGCYAAFLTPKGKMLGDLRILDDGDELALDTERVALQALFNMIRRYKIGADVELHKRTLQRALLSAVGPLARDVTGAGEAGLADTEHANGAARLDGAAVRLIATDVGVDVLCDAGDRGRVRAELLRRGAVEVADSTAECLRVERGRPRYGIDADETTIPQEAGLNERAVSFTKGCFLGQETVARLHYRGRPNRHLRGLRLSGAAATGDELRLAERAVGSVGSVADSPQHGPIALAIVRREAAPGATLAVGAQGEVDAQGAVSAEVVELPFR